jgi:hypothetical protein
MIQSKRKKFDDQNNNKNIMKFQINSWLCAQYFLQKKTFTFFSFSYNGSKYAIIGTIENIWSSN